MRRKEAMVRSNDLLAGARAGHRAFVNSRSVGEARSAAPTQSSAAAKKGAASCVGKNRAAFGCPLERLVRHCQLRVRHAFYFCKTQQLRQLPLRNVGELHRCAQ